MTRNLIPSESFYNFTNATKTTLIAMTTPIANVIPLESRLPIMITFISLYALIFFFGITGNALVVCMFSFVFSLENLQFTLDTSLKLSFAETKRCKR